MFRKSSVRPPQVNCALAFTPGEKPLRPPGRPPQPFAPLRGAALRRLLGAGILAAMTASLPALEIVAHRGSSDDAPENTVASAQLAWVRHADAVELDVHLTKDGRLVVIHDADTKRTTGISARVGEKSLRELQALDAGKWKSPKFAGERLPALEEMLATKEGRGRFFVELKGGPEMRPALKASLARAGLPANQVVIMAFDRDAVAAAKRELPQHEALWLVDKNWETPGLDQIIALARAAHADGINLSRKWPIDAAFVRKVKDAGLKIGVWTVDDVSEARRLREAGIDALTTNRPGWMREQL